MTNLETQVILPCPELLLEMLIERGESEPREAEYDPESEYIWYCCGKLRIDEGSDPMLLLSPRPTMFSLGSLRLRDIKDVVLAYMDNLGRRLLNVGISLYNTESTIKTNNLFEKSILNRRKEF